MNDNEEEKKAGRGTADTVPSGEEKKNPVSESESIRAVEEDPTLHAGSYDDEKEEDEKITLEDIEEFTDGFFVDSTKEEGVQKVQELYDDAVLFSGLKENRNVTTLHLPHGDVQFDTGYAGKAATDGLDKLSSVVRESDVVRSYFLSDAFMGRAMRSLGYENLEGMTEEHRKVYDDILHRGAELATNLRVGFFNEEALEEEYLHSACITLDEDGVTAVFINPNDEGLGISVLAHELAHHLYTYDHINPGQYAGEQEYGGSERRYGRDDSPLNTINATDVNDRVARAVYRGFFEHALVSAGFTDKQISEKVRDYVKKGDFKIHDNAGMERAADVHGVRLLMMQEGIWNPFTGADVTEKQVRQFRQQHPDSRIFEYWGNKEAAYYLNNIAMSDKVKPDAIRLGVTDDGRYRLVASVGKTDIERVITDAQYYKLMSLDDAKRGMLLSHYFGPESQHLDLSDGISVYDQAVDDGRTSLSESLPSEARTRSVRNDTLSQDLAAGYYDHYSQEMQDRDVGQHRGIGV